MKKTINSEIGNSYDKPTWIEEDFEFEFQSMIRVLSSQDQEGVMRHIFDHFSVKSLREPLKRNEKEAENTLRKYVENRKENFDFISYIKVPKRQSYIEEDFM
jgi:hypothetical protein